MTDQEKINNLYSRIKGFEFPECEDENFQNLVNEIKEGFDIILKGLIVASGKLKSD
ncbi:hypothetical protein [Sphingobacterium hungaricum]|uniref:hypothetical protein n=1 Tax=Sphingobacterium hungaricum TaxID=2082723 RepID=UPI0018CAFA34|nr:hypothetical protein [Sphingobacterium hungaricum]